MLFQPLAGVDPYASHMRKQSQSTFALEVISSFASSVGDANNLGETKGYSWFFQADEQQKGSKGQQFSQS